MEPFYKIVEPEIYSLKYAVSSRGTMMFSPRSPYEQVFDIFNRGKQAKLVFDNKEKKIVSCNENWVLYENLKDCFLWQQWSKISNSGFEIKEVDNVG